MNSQDHPIIQEEERLLRDVRTLLIERPVLTGASEHDIVEELHRLRTDIAQAKEEDKGSMLQQFDQLSALLGQLRRGRNHDELDPDCPYFAHIRLRESGRERDIFLGKASRTDHGLRIIDWRNAPIAQLFYRYAEGDEYAEELADRVVEGELTVRRTLTIAGGHLERIDSPQGVFLRDHAGDWARRVQDDPKLAGGQGSALLAHHRTQGYDRRLGERMRAERRREDKHLPDIAALIDPAQFELISGPDSGLVVVRGVAGSGKTTVALHRAAWLNFQDPQRFAPERMIVVVWGKALRDYISKVLPALGVEGVTAVTWGQWSQELMRRHFPMLPRKTAEDTPEVVSRLKLHPGLLPLMRRVVEQNTGAPTAHGVLDDWLSLFMRLENLRDNLAVTAPGAFSDVEIERAWAWLSRQRYALQAWMEGDREETLELDAEDDALLLRFWQLRVGPLRNRSKRPLRYTHMIVDEVQDLSPVELAVLLDTLDDARCATLAGDTQQHIQTTAGFSSWSELLDHLSLETTEVNTLKVSYRSTEPITSFALQVLGPLREDHVPPLTTRGGAPVELFRFTDHGGCVAFLGEALRELVSNEPLASIAVLTANEELSKIYADGLVLAEVPGVRLVHDQEFAFKPGVEVTEVSEVKGLEFDYVILVEVSARCYPDDSHARRLLHVGATRAVHQLWLTSVGTPSPMLNTSETGAVGESSAG
ncbi:MAG: ATP-binding domain-containing protein [Deltaproteobacteria bacterium]|nr:ATP-binding domain-containing protein [Deltaproteobacteria bacterium]MBK9643885.1 ATP-binding domain-containing protein [Deltaproteobacteria bacterium]